MNSIGERLKYIRTLYDLTLQEIKICTGISTGNYSDLENNKSLPSTSALISLCREFKVSSDWILLGEGEAPEKINTDYTKNNISIPELSIGKRIRLLRVYNNISMVHLARLLEVDVSLIKLWENDEIDEFAITKITSYFKVNKDWLLTGYEHDNLFLSENTGPYNNDQIKNIITNYAENYKSAITNFELNIDELETISIYRELPLEDKEELKMLIKFKSERIKNFKKKSISSGSTHGEESNSKIHA